VDALVGKQTRDHKDIDIVIRQSDGPRLDEVLGGAGYRLVEGGRPFNYVMTDRGGREIDVHSVVFDADGNGLYGPGADPGDMYPAGSLDGEGTIGDRQVGCVAPKFLVAFHTGYEIKESDVHDVYALHRRFGVPLPKEYAGRESSD
jgi:lincosamide nucleotidyltransferase A/C/D/E